jgi:hypothetical protein
MAINNPNITTTITMGTTIAMILSVLSESSSLVIDAASVDESVVVA